MREEALMENGDIPQLIELIPGIYDGMRVNCEVRCFEYSSKTGDFNTISSEDYLLRSGSQEELIPLLFDKDLFNWRVLEASVEYHELKGVKYKWLRIILKRSVN